MGEKENTPRANVNHPRTFKTQLLRRMSFLSYFIQVRWDPGQQDIICFPRSTFNLSKLCKLPHSQYENQ